MQTLSPWTLDTGRKLNVYKTFRRRPGCFLNVLCTFNLHAVSKGLDEALDFPFVLIKSSCRKHYIMIIIVIQIIWGSFQHYLKYAHFIPNLY